MSKDYQNFQILSRRLGDINLRMRNFTNQLVALEDSKTQVYDAVVSPIYGLGDYLTLRDAVAAGAQSIYIRAGDYVETGSFTINSRCIIVGESTEDVRITFEGLVVPPFTISNTAPIIYTGTITATSGSDQVVGVGTDFTQLSAGAEILIENDAYEIASIEDATHLTLERLFRGNTRAGLSFLATTFLNTVIIKDVKILNSTTNPCTAGGFVITGVHGAFYNSIHIEGFTPNAVLNHCYDTHIIDTHTEHSTGAGFTMNDCISAFLVRSSAVNSTGDGYDITGVTIGSSTVLFSQCELINNAGNGINIGDGTNLVNFVNCQTINNGNAGIRSTNGTSNIVISSCNMNHNVDAVNLAGSFNILTSNIITNNSGIGIRAGDDSLISSNYIANCGSYGVWMQSDVNNVISSNHIDSCGNSGIYASGNAANNTISANHIDLNTNYGVYMNGQGENTITGNVIRNNTVAGVRISDDDNSITGNNINSNTTGVIINAGAANNLIVANQYTNNTTPLSDAGTLTIAVNNSV